MSAAKAICHTPQNPTASQVIIFYFSFIHSNGFWGAGTLDGAGGCVRRIFTSSGVTSSPEFPNELYTNVRTFAIFCSLSGKEGMLLLNFIPFTITSPCRPNMTVCTARFLSVLKKSDPARGGNTFGSPVLWAGDTPRKWK
jgi:hypothetical protein